MNICIDYYRRLPGKATFTPLSFVFQQVQWESHFQRYWLRIALWMFSKHNRLNRGLFEWDSHQSKRK